jgi:hypothetical protein
MTPPNNHTCDFMSQPLVPSAAGNDYPSLPEHVPKITTGQCLLHPGINPWLPLRSGFIWRTIAPGGSDEEQLATVEHDHPLTLRRGDIIGRAIVIQRFEVEDADMGAKRIGVIAQRF